MNRLTYYGGRATGLRQDTLRLSLGLNPHEYEDDYQGLTARDRDSYRFFMGNPVLEQDGDRVTALRQRAALAMQAAMAEGVVSVQEYENFRFMLPTKETFIGLTDWLVRIREKRPALEAHLGDGLWKD